MLKYFLVILGFSLTSCNITTPGLVTINFEASSLAISPTIELETESDPTTTGGSDNQVFINSKYSDGLSSNEVDPGTYTFTATIQFDSYFECETEDTTVTYELEVVSDEEYSIYVYPTGCDISVSGF